MSTEQSEEMVTISKKVYNSLVEDADMLFYLEAAGVDNWEGYDIAMAEWRASRYEDEE